VKWQRRCASVEDTQAAGEDLAFLLQSGDIVLLSGQLGAGKTTSPTFIMVRPHQAHNDQGITTLLHADVYRVESMAEVLDLALGELVEESAVALIEWGELASSLFGQEVLKIQFQIDEQEGRVLEISGALASGRHVELDRWAAK
jgi:tRNA threonylcarbamoyladenosine biosynthesis protein TsaE